MLKKNTNLGVIIRQESIAKLKKKKKETIANIYPLCYS